MNRLLSVCIPVYNRPKYLKRLLKSVIPQSKALKVPIYIGDDSTNEESKKIIKSFKHKLLFYSKNERNINKRGENWISLIKKNKTKFSWILGQDEVVLPQSVKILLEAIQKRQDLQFIWVNGLLKEGNKRIKLLSIPNDLFFNDCVEFFYEVRGHNRLGVGIVDSEKFLEANYKKYQNTFHVFQGGVWEYLAKYRKKGPNKIKMISKPLIVFGGAKKTWCSNYAEVTYYDRFHCFNLLPKIYKQEINKIWKEEVKIKGKFKKLIKDRYFKLINISKVKKWFTYFPFYIKIKAITVCILPFFLVRAVFALMQVAGEPRKIIKRITLIKFNKLRKNLNDGKNM